MPWLQKDEVLFIHVPRCGGTSLTKHHKVGIKAQEGKILWRRIGITYFNYRYKLLEKTNFPLVTIENAIALIQFTLASVLFVLFPGLVVPYIMWVSSCTTFCMSTFIWTAPVLMRTDMVRYFFMMFQYYVLCKFNADEGYLTGVNNKGYLLHLTAERIIRYGYCQEADVKRKSFSIVRNPYSRVVSMYEYNKRPCESFEHFVRDFHKKCIKTYHKKKKTDSKDIYCHVIPMHCYTHINGKQVVNTIIKQEQLKRLVATEWADSGVPDIIQKALTGIPHANSRKKRMPWQQYYNQDTMDLVLEMYERDFDLFGYDKFIPKRSDLIPKVKTKVYSQNTETTEAREAGTLLRLSLGRDLRSSTQGEIPSHIGTPESKTHDEAEDVVRIKENGHKSVRRVSIAQTVESKVFEPTQKISDTTTVAAGEPTSEARSTSLRLPVQKQQLTKQDIVSKKRAASAFVIHEVSTA